MMQSNCRVFLKRGGNFLEPNIRDVSWFYLQLYQDRIPPETLKKKRSLIVLSSLKKASLKINNSL